MEAMSRLGNRRSGVPPIDRSSLQLAFELVQKTPVRVLGDDLLRARLDEPQFAEPQGLEADRILVIVLSPFVVRELAQCLQRIVVSRGEAVIDETLGGALGHAGAEVGGL